MAKLLTYDLGSENTPDLTTTEAFKMVRSVRVSCTQKLYRVGTQTTESVLLVPECRVDRIQETIDIVREAYHALNGWLKEHNQDVQLKPVFIVHKVARYQVSAYKDLAERALVAKIKKTLADLVALTEKIQGFKSEKKRRKILYNLNRQYKLWEDLGQIVDNLQIFKPSAYYQLIREFERRMAEAKAEGS